MRGPGTKVGGVRVVHVYKDYLPVVGGIEGALAALAERQAAAGLDVMVLVTNPGGLAPRERRAGVQVIRAARVATVASTPLSVTLPTWLRRLRPDLVHLHHPYPVGEVAQLLADGRWPFVVTYHSDVVRQQRLDQLYRPVRAALLRRAARIMPTSDGYARSSPVLRRLAGRCTTVPLGIDPTAFLGTDPPLRRGTPTLLFVGRHRHYKGVDVLLSALPHVDARLVVVGDGPCRSEWQRQAKRLGLDGRVRFVGEVPAADLPDLYAAADLLVLPSTNRAEAFGLVLLEAMASGLPCVTSELGTGTSEVVCHDVTGLVVPPGDPTALAAALEALARDPERRHAFGQAGRKRVLTHYTLDRMVEGVAAVYQAVLV